MRAGTAWVDITPTKPLCVAGQLHRRIGEYTHDPLTANAVAFDDGASRVVIVSCDLLYLPIEFTDEVQAVCHERFDIPARSVLIACTHTHVGPCTNTRSVGEVSPEYMDGLRASLVEVIGRALDDLEDVALYAGTGRLDELGFNRRGCHSDGRADMYHGSWNDNFDGLEGPRDGRLPVIFARRASDGGLKVLIPSFATHPTSMEGDCFYSADIPGSLRAFLRRNLGDEVGIVYLTGAAGNTSPMQLENNPERDRRWYDEVGWERCGTYIGAEVLKVIASTTEPMADPMIRLAQAVEPIPMRPYPTDFDPEKLSWGRDYFAPYRDDWPRMLREESPVEVRLNVLRLGDAVICTNPAELYVEHGLAIKDASPASVTIVSELTDGHVGYVPTTEAFAHGGYSVWPAWSSKLAEDAGDIIVESTGRLLREAFPDD